MNGLLQDAVTARAERRPHASAIVFKGAHVTYEALEVGSNRLARVLADTGVAPGDRVCLLCPKSPTAIEAMLAALKIGAIYVPLDPMSPPARLAKMIAACDTRWILAAGNVSSTLEQLVERPDLQELSVGWLDDAPAPNAPLAFRRRDVAMQPGHRPRWTGAPSDPAHILFTSGSTGVPKGVVITHANVRAFLAWAVRYFGTTPSDRISGHPPLHFDLSTFDIYGAFTAGAELHLVPPELNLVPHRLAELIRTSGLTQWFSVPSVMTYMARFDTIAHNDFPALKRVLWCGEVLPVPVLRYWMERLPHVTFTNLYGPTEATIASSYYTVPSCPDDGAGIPIGRACDGEELLVLDDALRPVATGTLGNLYIRGAGLSPGYWRDPEKTRAAFLPYPGSIDPADRIYRTGDLASVDADGVVHFAGRADNQVKTRGHRVELGEVEAALYAVPAVRECAVLGVPSGDFDGVALCCVYVPADEDGVAAETALRTAALHALPPYMVPSRWRALAEMPRTPSGKVDRNKLKALFAPQAGVT